ncbi:MAG: hypothetical protein PUH36_03575 [Subdoligranulum sp.]|nr:hypothetical protein [Subdoligranulum sp.]
MQHLQNISVARHGIGFFRAAIASSSDPPAGLYFFQKSFFLPHGAYGGCRPGRGIRRRVLFFIMYMLIFMQRITAKPFFFPFFYFFQKNC